MLCNRAATKLMADGADIIYIQVIVVTEIYWCHVLVCSFFFMPGHNQSCPGSLKPVLFHRLGKKYRVLNHGRFYPFLPNVPG